MHELSLHVLDLVENSTGAGADQVTVTVEENSIRDELRIRIEDNGRGMDADMVAKVTDPFVTTRTTRKVGLGLPLMDMTTRMCDGGLSGRLRPGPGHDGQRRYSRPIDAGDGLQDSRPVSVIFRSYA